MTIPVGFAGVTHIFGGTGLPLGGAITYGIDHDSSVPAVTAAQDLHNEFAATILPELATVVNLVATLVKFGPDATGPSGQWEDTIPGGDAQLQTSSNVTYLVHKNTSLGGRRGRGRWYLPGVTEVQVGAGGAIQAAKQNALQIAVSAFRGAVIALPFTTGLFVLHEPSAPGTENPSPEPAPTVIDLLSVDSFAATQRRRMRR